MIDAKVNVPTLVVARFRAVPFVVLMALVALLTVCWPALLAVKPAPPVFLMLRMPKLVVPLLVVDTPPATVPNVPIFTAPVKELATLPLLIEMPVEAAVLAAVAMLVVPVTPKVPVTVLSSIPSLEAPGLVAVIESNDNDDATLVSLTAGADDATI